MSPFSGPSPGSKTRTVVRAGSQALVKTCKVPFPSCDSMANALAVESGSGFSAIHWAAIDELKQSIGNGFTTAGFTWRGVTVTSAPNGANASAAALRQMPKQIVV